MADLRQASSGPDTSTRGRSSAILSGFGKIPQCERSEPLFPLNFSLNFICLRKFLQCERSEPLFPNEVVLQFEVNGKIEEEHKIEEVVEIEVEHKIVEEVLGQFGGFWSTLRRFLQAGSTFVDFLAKSLSVDFCTPFLGSIFDPFSDFSLRAICLFYGTFLILGTVLDPFWDLFWDVHLTMILAFLGSCFHPPEVPVFEVVFIKGPEWVLVAHFSAFSTLLVLAFAIFFRKAN